MYVEMSLKNRTKRSCLGKSQIRDGLAHSCIKGEEIILKVTPPPRKFPICKGDSERFVLSDL